MANQQFKIVLVGAGGVGKTTFLKRLRTGEFERRYVATLGVEVHPLNLETNHGNIVFNTWDCAGQERFSGLCEGYYIRADAALIMVDNTSKLSFKCVPYYLRDLREVNPNMPIVLCSNKVDCGRPNRQVSSTFLQEFKETHEIEHVLQISAKSNYNFDKPFLYLLKKLVNEDCEYDYH